MPTRFSIPRITRPLRLEEYAPEFGDAVIDVWVNPPRALLAERLELARRSQAARSAVDVAELELIGDAVLKWFAQVWKDWSADEIRALVEETADTDPGLWSWLSTATVRLIEEHRRQAKNA